MGLDCRQCTSIDKINRGCEADSPIEGKWQYPGRPGQFFQRCPRKMVTRESHEYIDAYYFLAEFQKFPNSRGAADGYLNQSAKFIQAVRIIMAEISRMRKEDLKI